MVPVSVVVRPRPRRLDIISIQHLTVRVIPVTWDPNANALNLAGSLGVKADGEDLTWDLGILHGLGPAKSHKGSGLFSSSSHEHELDYEAKLGDKNRNLNRFTLIISGDYAELTLRDATTAIVATFSGSGQQTGLDSIYDGHWWRDPDFGTVKYYEKEKGTGPPEPIIEGQHTFSLPQGA